MGKIILVKIYFLIRELRRRYSKNSFCWIYVFCVIFLILSINSASAIAPDILIIYPENNTNSSNANLNVNYTVSDNVGISSCWYSNDSYIVNLSLGSNCDNITNITWSEGQHNVTIWANDNSGNENSSSVVFSVNSTNQTTTIDSANNMFVNITSDNSIVNNTPKKSYSLFGEGDDTTPPVCVLISRFPEDMNDTSSGRFTVLLNCSDDSGINVTKSGDHYFAFATRTLDSFQVAAGVPNRWSIRPPINNLAQVDPNLSSYGPIFRAQGRGRNFWYEFLNGASPSGPMNLSSWFYYDNYSYTAEDGHYGYLTVTNESATNAILNFTSSSVRLSAFRQNIPLSYDSLVSESKKNLTINKNLQLLVYRNDLEAMKGSKNYTIIVYRDIGTTSQVPTANLRAFYCNSSYSPTGGITVLASPNCVSLNSITPASLSTIILSDRNSSYSQGSYSVTDGKIGGIVATGYHYYYYDTLETNPNRAFNYRYVNGTTVTNVSFNDTKRTWTSTNNGANWIQFNATLDLIEFTTKALNDEFQFGYCVYDLAGNLGCNSTLFSDVITPTNHQISSPFVVEYNSSAFINDLSLNETHNRIMNIRIGCAKDPDSVGNVTHNLTLRNNDGTFNYTINGSFVCPNDAQTWITFNTSLVPDGIYRMNLTATSGDNNLDIKTYLTYNNFMIDSIYPTFSSYWDNNGTQTGIGTALFNVTVANTNGTVILMFNGTNYVATNSSGDATVFNATIIDLANGTYSYNWISYGNGVSGNYNISDNQSYTVLDDIQNPQINIVYPINDTNTTNANLNVNYTVSDNVGISSCWYSNDSYIVNLSLGSNCDNITNITWSEGQHNVTIWANDSSGNENSSEVSFLMDTTEPEIIDTTSSSENVEENTEVNFTANSSDSGGLANATLNIYNETGLYNKTTVDLGGVFSAIIGIPVKLINGIYYWFWEIFDISGNGYVTNNKIITSSYVFSIDSISPPSSIILTAFQTSTVYLVINITDSSRTLNASASKCYLSKIGEVQRNSTSCINQSQSGNDYTLNCSLDMWFYDSPGIWNATCVVENTKDELNDTVNATVDNLDYIDQEDSTVNWFSIVPGTNNSEANNSVTFANGGNRAYSLFNITSQNASSGLNIIPAENFMISPETGQLSGFTSLNSSGVIWADGSLSKCVYPCLSNTTEVAYFYVNVPNGIPTGVYTSTNSWKISIT